MKKHLLITIMIIFTSTLLSAYDKQSTDAFNSKESIYVLRSIDGEFLTNARINIEWWEGDDLPVFVVNDTDGNFIVHGDGEIEFFSGTCKLILREFDGSFIAHTDIYEDFCYLL